jgi:hypothetical protein
MAWRTIIVANSPTPSTEELDSDAEITHLPSGLLDSPPHQADILGADSMSVYLQNLCAACIIPPQPAVLPTPPLVGGTSMSQPTPLSPSYRPTKPAPPSFLHPPCRCCKQTYSASYIGDHLTSARHGARHLCCCHSN